MTQSTKIGCPLCKHYQFDGTCTAYPKGILFGFLAGIDKHLAPTKNQENEIVFERISPEEQRQRAIAAIAKHDRREVAV